MSDQIVSNFSQGVSQQAAQQRRDSQCESQFDCFNSPVDGAGARPPTEIVKVFPGKTLTGALFTELERGGTENYLAGVYNALPFAINLDSGVEGAITGGNGDGYLTAIGGALPRDQFRAQAVEDVTFIASRLLAPAMASTVSATRYPEALVFVRAPAFDAWYRLKLRGPASIDAFVRTKDSSGSGPTEARTVEIAEALKVLIDGVSGYTASTEGSLIYITRPDHADFTIEANDDNGDDFMYAFKGFCSSYSKLPRKGFDGFILEVQGESKTQADNYYVQFQGASSTGSWVEVVGPNVKTTIDKATMPHTLTITGLNTFTYGSQDWSTRIAGDEDTSPDPSFIGRRLRDLFYHKSRLGFLTEGGAVWSKTRFPYTFWADTLQTVLATAPVDVRLVAGGKGSSFPDLTVAIDEAFFIWAQKVQFRISNGQDNFKQESISADPTTAYEYAKGAEPLPVGSSLYFASEVGPYAYLRSVLFQNGRAQGDIDVSAQVNKYLLSGIQGLTASDTLRVLFMYGTGEPSVLNVWNYLYQQQEYVQSAWNKWRLPGGTILWAGVRGNVLRVLQQRAEGVALLKVDLTPKLVDNITGAGYLTRLDMRVDQTQVTSLSFNSGTGNTSFTLPYTPTDTTVNDVRVILAESEAGAGKKRGYSYPVVSVVGAVVTVKGDLTGLKFYAGQRIVAERTESRFYVRTQQGVAPYDRITVNRFHLELADTGYTRIEVATPNKATRGEVFEARTAGLPGSLTGTPVPATGKLNQPIAERAGEYTMRFVNDSYLPSYWQAGNYDYTLTK